MAYQPMYATVTDNQGGQGHTLTLRGLVYRVSAWINSELGDVVNASASIDDRIPKTQSTNHAYNKLQYFLEKHKTYLEERKPINDKKEAQKSFLTANKLKEKIEYWQKRYNEAKSKEQARKVYLSLSLGNIKPERLEVNFCGIKFNAKDLELLKEYDRKDFLGGLAIAPAFALIPDIKRVVEAKTDKDRKEATDTFISKRNKLANFFKEEQGKSKI